jgi:hypothetical protein
VSRALLQNASARSVRPPQIVSTDAIAAELGEWARGFALDQQLSGASLRKTKSPLKAAGLRQTLRIWKILERAKGLEPSTPTLARSCSTTELHPHQKD